MARDGSNCRSCGGRLRPDQSFCPECGKPAGDDGSPPEPDLSSRQHPFQAGINPPADSRPKAAIRLHPPRPGKPGSTGKGPWSDPVLLGGFPIPRPILFAVLGIPLALALRLVMCGMMGFATGLLFHETGHAAVAIFFGHPAIPSAAGVCHVYDRSLPFALLVWAAMGGAAWYFRTKPAIAVLLGVAAVLSLALGFSSFHETLISLAGHGAEIAFACIFLWRALQGGLFNEFERPLYAMLGWYLLGANLSMFWKLRTSVGFRTEYLGNSCSGGPNDFEVVAGAHGIRLETVAGWMLAWGIVTAASVLGAWLYLSLRNRHDPARLK